MSNEEEEEEEKKGGSFRFFQAFGPLESGGGIDAGINIRDKFFAVTHPLHPVTSPSPSRCHVIKRLRRRRHRRCDGNRVEA